MHMEINFTPDIEECLKGLVKAGRYGNTIEEVVKRLIQDRVFILPDVKRWTICGLMLLKYDKGWISRNVPGSNFSNNTALKNVKENWATYSTEEMPQKYGKEE